jgi:hypothetical protein
MDRTVRHPGCRHRRPVSLRSSTVSCTFPPFPRGQATTVGDGWQPVKRAVGHFGPTKVAGRLGPKTNDREGGSSWAREGSGSLAGRQPLHAFRKITCTGIGGNDPRGFRHRLRTDEDLATQVEGSSGLRLPVRVSNHTPPPVQPPAGHHQGEPDHQSHNRSPLLEPRVRVCHVVHDRECGERKQGDRGTLPPG